MTALATVKKAYAAWESKDIEALSKLLHSDYKATMPGGMEIVGIEGAKQCMNDCPFPWHSENEQYIVDGDKVVRIFDMVVEGEGDKGFNLRMAELNVVKDGKVIFNEAFFDTSACPKEMQEQAKEHHKKQPATSST